MVEDDEDGRVDEDFPPLERLRKIKQFGVDQFALCQASDTESKADLYFNLDTVYYSMSSTLNHLTLSTISFNFIIWTI